MVRLNRLSLLSLSTVGFNDVRINGALSKPLSVLKFFSFFLENFDKQTTDDLTFGFGIGNSG